MPRGMPVRNGNGAKNAGHAGAGLLLRARLYASLGIALMDFAKQEMKRKNDKRRLRKCLD